MDCSATEYFLALDVDFIPPENAESIISHMLYRMDVCDSNNIRVRRGLSNDDTVYIVPAFEFLPRNRTISDEEVPESVDDLLSLYDKNLAQPIRIDYWAPGQGATDFPRWISNARNSSIGQRTEVSYQIQHEKRFEPYVVASRYSAPRFENSFRGFGYDKLSWFQEVACMGFRFHVLSDVFIIHMNHPIDRTADNNNEDTWKQFQSRLQEKYPLRCGNTAM